MRKTARVEREARKEAEEECTANQSSDGIPAPMSEDEMAEALRSNMENLIGSRVHSPDGRPGTIVAVDPDDRLLPIKVQYQ